MADDYDISDLVMGQPQPGLSVPVMGQPSPDSEYDISHLASPAPAPGQQVIQNARAPDGTIYKSYEPGWRHAAASTGQAILEGAAPVLDVVSWPARVMLGELGLDKAPSDYMAEHGLTGNPNLTPGMDWSIPQRRAYSAVKGAMTGLPFGPAGAVGGASGEVSGDAAKDAGWPLAGQIAASMVGGLAGTRAIEPGVQALSGGLREPNPVMAEYAKNAITPRLPADTDGLMGSSLQYVVGKLPWSKSNLEGAANQTVGDFANRATALAGGVNAPSTTQAGEALQTGAQSWLQGLRDTNNKNFSALNMYFRPGDKVPLTNTLGQLDAITSVMPDAPATAKLVNPGFFQRLKSSLGSDMTSPLVDQNGNAIQKSGGLSWDTIKGLRSQVGDMLTNTSAYPDINTAQLKRLYGSLTEDMKAAATAKGQGASDAFNKASTEAKNGYDKIDTVMSGLLKDGATPEQAYAFALNTPSRLVQLQKDLPADKWDVLKNAVTNKLGWTSESGDQAVGRAFSTQRYLNQWNNLHPDVKQALYGNDPDHLAALNSLAKVADNMKSADKLTKGNQGRSDVMALLEAGAAHHVGGVGAVAGLPVAGFSASRLITNPGFVKWLGTQPTGKLSGMRLRGLAGVAASNPAIAPDIKAFQSYAEENQ